MKFLIFAILLISNDVKAETIFTLAQKTWATSSAHSINEVMDVLRGISIVCKDTNTYYPTEWSVESTFPEVRTVGDQDIGYSQSLVFKHIPANLDTNTTVENGKVVTRFWSPEPDSLLMVQKYGIKGNIVYVQWRNFNHSELDNPTYESYYSCRAR